MRAEVPAGGGALCEVATVHGESELLRLPGRRGTHGPCDTAGEGALSLPGSGGKDGGLEMAARASRGGRTTNNCLVGEGCAQLAMFRDSTGPFNRVKGFENVRGSLNGECAKVPGCHSGASNPHAQLPTGTEWTIPALVFASEGEHVFTWNFMQGQTSSVLPALELEVFRICRLAHCHMQSAGLPSLGLLKRSALFPTLQAVVAWLAFGMV